MTTTEPTPITSPAGTDGASAAPGKRRRWVMVAVAALPVAVILYFLLIQLTPPSFNGMVIQSPQRATDFTLNASTGERISLSDLRGQTVLLFFGYTFCPDVCPTSIADLTQAMQILGPKKADKVQVVFVSVDPERDTPDRLREYLSYFNPDFLGMTGTADELIAASTPFGIFYEKHDGTPATGYLVDHTATITLIDKDGYVRLVFPYGLGADKMAEDLDHLVR